MNMFKMLGNLGKLQQEMQALQAELAEKRYRAAAGGEMVTVVVDGTQKLHECNIDPKLVEDGDRELIEELVIAATNQAISVAREDAASAMQQKVGENFDMPGLSGLMQQFLPK